MIFCATGLWVGLGLATTAPASAATTLSYTYDELGRLVTVTHDDGTAITNTYDPADNRTLLSVGGMPTHFTVSASETPAVEGGDVTFTVTRTGDIS
ncbi:RHS repeat domain-containing protein [Magnetospira sp. QH-2]|uniref:RHS repeat domain-containing protein n=1 Tax=Magnetospira sp. (strain QH-2) TaxID=1288970 RepID=UPI0003E81241|nr:RHS repeat domain-containing protein [Magnetospira sp. QH-2]CCQ74720.1 exported protein of unknown function with RHS repeat [Magnetospira sp. QH-2]